MTDFSITAVVLAAGLSERMGRFKPLLPLGTTRTIERVVNFFQAAGVGDILVVAGYRAGDVQQAIESLNVRCLENADFHQGMFTSVLAGIHALPQQCRAFFIHPADIPLVRPQTVKRLMTAGKETGAAIVYPTFDGRRGHPPLIHSRLGPEILAWHGGGGLRAFLQRYEADSCELPVADEAVLQDLDTPADYDRMLERLDHADVPTEAECRVLMEGIQNLPVSIAVHCRAVSVAAHRLAGALRTAGVTLDLELVRTAALLHDIARAEKDHAGAGSRLLVCHGFIRLAPIVAVHMDLAVRRDQPVDEAQVVYLADKMMDGDRCVDMEQRFRRKMAEFNGDHRAVEAIGRRWESARMVRDKVEKITGRSIKTIVEKPSGSFDGET